MRRLPLVACGCGLAYGALVIALAPAREFVAGVRAVRSLGESLAAATEAMADEVITHFEESAGEILGTHDDSR